MYVLDSHLLVGLTTLIGMSVVHVTDPFDAWETTALVFFTFSCPIAPELPPSNCIHLSPHLSHAPPSRRLTSQCSWLAAAAHWDSGC